MIRNDQNTIATGGRSAAWNRVQPGERRVQIMLEDAERAECGISTAQRTVPVSSSGRPNRISGAPSGWL